MEMEKYSDEIRNLIKHENELVNHRLGWLMTAQALLYTALSLIWKSGFNEVLVIGLVGILSSLTFGYSLKFSDKAIGRLLSIYREQLKNKSKKEENYAPVIGYEGKTTLIFLPWNFMPWLLVAAWVSLIALRSCV